MRVVVLAVVVACGGDPAVMNDAGVGADASPDAPPDASCTGIDTDSDGVCDSVDVCPQVNDPGQADLDGDGLGWACDPIEKVDIPNVAQNPMLEMSFAGSTYGLNVFSANGTHVLAVGAGGLVNASSATTPWMTVPTYGPYVSPDQHVFVSTGDGAGRLALDGTFTVEEPTKRILGTSHPLRRLSYILLQTLGQPAVIGIPNGMAIDVLAAPSGYQDVERAVSPAGVGAVLYRHFSPVQKTTLQRWEAGTAMIVDEFDALQLFDETKMIFCGRKGSQVEVIELRPGATFRAPLPMSGCSSIGTNGTTENGYFIMGAGTTMTTKLAAVLVRGDTITTVESGDASAPDVSHSKQVVGTALQVLVTNTRAYAVTPTNTVTALTITSKDAVSAHGDTLHFVDISGPNAVLKRWRSDGIAAGDARCRNDREGPDNGRGWRHRRRQRGERTVRVARSVDVDDGHAGGAR